MRPTGLTVKVAAGGEDARSGAGRTVNGLPKRRSLSKGITYSVVIQQLTRTGILGSENGEVNRQIHR